jgi:hypothetical protein
MLAVQNTEVIVGLWAFVPSGSVTRDRWGAEDYPSFYGPVLVA